MKTPSVSFSINCIVIALVAATCAQVIHEVTHGVFGLLAGQQWTALNLFATLTEWVDTAPTVVGGLLVAGSAAIVNIVTAVIAAYVFLRKRQRLSPLLTLFTFLFAAYSFLLGFGYFMSDAAFYNPDAPTGDWMKVIALLNGSVVAQISIGLIGALGTLYTFFWIGRNARTFVKDTLDKKARVDTLLSVLLYPYLVVNVIFSILAWWHPLETAGFVITIIQYWFGYSGIFWGFFLGAYWLAVTPAKQPATTLPTELALPWVLGGLSFFTIVVAVLLPTVYF